MTHIGADTLTAIALGASPSAPERCHLARCVVCAKHLAALARVVEAAGSSSPADVPRPPPQRLWRVVENAIRHENPPKGGAL